MNSNFNKICRLCLRICEEYVDLNGTNRSKSLTLDLIEKIKFCYMVNVDLSEQFPTKVCYECIQVLSFFYTAKKNVLSSENFLRDTLLVEKNLQFDCGKEDATAPDDKLKKKTISQCQNDKENNSNGPSNTSNNNSKNLDEFKKKSKIQNQENSNADVDTLLSISNTNLEILRNFRDLKELEYKRKRNLKHSKGRSTRISKENLVKEIGTVIDKNNILSSGIKRTRKTSGKIEHRKLI